MKIEGKLTGAVHRFVELDRGPSYTNPQEEVIELRFRSAVDSYSTHCIVISKDLAELLHQAFQYTK
jgi:hypothetical protein